MQQLNEQTIDIPPFDFFGFIIENWIAFLLIYVFLIYIYNKVFRTRKLPILKNAVVYIMLLIGAFVLLIFQIDAGLPIVYCLGIAVGLMLIVRVRYYLAERRGEKL